MEDGHLQGLNPPQLEAAQELNRHCAVLSCPGSGKTKTVESKVANILIKDPKAFVCCTTFSKEGATEIRERVYAKLPKGEQYRSRLIISTFHSLCYHAIRKQKGSAPKIVSPGERMYHIKGAAIDVGINTKSDEFQTALEALDSYATHPDERLNSLPPQTHKLHARYKERIHAAGKLDFEDLLTTTVECLESGQMTPSPYTHVICDEGQDSDSLMLRWLMVYASAGAVITLMLDDDQTLYSFRNSLGVSICRHFESELQARIIHNSTNYRSREEVLVPARKLIRCNHDRIDKEVLSNRGPGGSFDVYHFHSQKGTKSLLKEVIKSPGDWFILCRTNSDIEVMAGYLAELGIPYEGPDMPPITERPEVQSYLELLSTLANRHGHGLDMAAISCIASEQQILEILDKSGCESLTVASETGLTAAHLQGITSKQIALLSELITKSRAWEAAVAEGRTNRAIRLAGQWMENNYPGDPQCIQTVMNILVERTSGTMEQRLSKLQQLFDRNTEKPAGGSVRLMTAHSSKGLQRKSVMIWSLREGAFPSTPEEESMLPNHFEEERRVLYVAMTRAEDHLHLVYQSSKVNAKRITNYHPSRFFIDMGIELGEPIVAISD
ncbi:ATP-dependent helicase [Thalassolituus marinus]|uniref:DNA 3'-5' helicase n=1 Tax=Thalassolituus marinus TaxID=671053 RepID=A0ABS7ZUP8_9GAMM|nr:ATP-dependent helicase [Thalassolituus marinus]MCA6065406.1 ATP-dependent helicase [Thalassolituus marinus]